MPGSQTDLFTRSGHREEDEQLARQIGTRIREARRRAGLTQQQLATGRYTKAYVSALEHGIARPSMAALTFFADRLGVRPSTLVGDDSATWTRLEADVLLASGRWQQAVDAFESQLAAGADASRRAELLLGLAEGLARLGRGPEGAAAAAEAAAGLRAAGRENDAVRAEYWLALAEQEQGHPAEARALFQSILARVRGGLMVEPDFGLRVLLALAAVEAHEGDHAAAQGYLAEVQGLADTLDARRRAAFYYDLAATCRGAGDVEGALRSGYASLALYRALDSEVEIGILENGLALAFVELGVLDRAEELAASARARFEHLQHERGLGHVLDTEGRIALARGEAEPAFDLAHRARELAEKSSDTPALIDALLTEARACLALGRPNEAGPRFARAAELARASGGPARLRAALRDWAALLAEQGDHRGAYELTREALRD